MDELLQEYARTGSDEAFAKVVRRHIDIVYSAALRQVGGDVHLAKDVAQLVFADLSRKAPALARHPALIAWLYTSTHYSAAKLLRTERRRQRREQEAFLMNEPQTHPSGEPEWDVIRPVLDDAMHSLPERERAVLVLRFFGKYSLTDIGTQLSLTESGARKCMERGLEKLRVVLGRRGITSTPAALGLALADRAVFAAPPGLAATIAGSAAATGGTGALATFTLMSTAKIAAFAAAGGAIAASFLLVTKPVSEVPRHPDHGDLQIAADNTKIEVLSVTPTTVTGSPAIARPERLNRWRENLEEAKAAPATPRTRIRFLSQGGGISDSLATIFEITPADQQSIGAAIQEAKRELSEFTAAHAAVVQPDQYHIKVTVPPFPEGSDVFAAFRNKLQQILGSERSEALLNFQADEIDGALFSFGSTQRTLVVLKSADGNALVTDMVDTRPTARGGISAAGGMRMGMLIDSRNRQYDWDWVVPKVAPLLDSIVFRPAPK